jgi:hypothetical protein
MRSRGPSTLALSVLTATLADVQGDYQRAFEEIRELAPRADRVATVRDLVLRRDVAEFRLAEGTLSLLTPVAGQTVGAVFMGRGSVSLRPPLAVERAHMRRVLSDSVLDAPISAAVFLFADSTLAELERQVTFGQGAVDRAAAGRVGDALGFLVDPGERRADPALMTAILNRETDGFFSAYIKRARGEDLTIQVDPYQIEEVVVLRRGKQRLQRTEVVSQFQRTEDHQRGVAAADEQPDPLRVEAYRIESWIAGDLDFSASATLRLRALRDSIRWVRFGLFDELRVDSVVRAAASPGATSFFRHDRSGELWVRFDPPLRQNVQDSVRVVYHGDLIARGSVLEPVLPSRADPRRQRLGRLDQWAFIKSTGAWFPRYGGWGQFSDFELTFHSPRRYRLASIGKQVESRVEGNVLTTRWVSEAPTNQVSFNLGEFEEFRITDPRIPPVTVHVNAEAHFTLAEFFMGQRDPEQQVGGDLANSLAFFTRVFGAPLFQQYYATEIPYFHGQAFPGMIHLSWWTFQSTRETGWEEIFRAHEMAHQWWGIGVEPADYRDVWLSEGFSMFAGLWYMQLILRDNEKYFKQLRDWRGAIRAARDDAPPVGLGTRALQRKPEHYDLMVYRKGGWVLHMLRNMMLDLKTMNEDAFGAMMREFYETYRGRRASTKDFQAVVEKHLKQPMDWFFDQWVYGTAIPTYVFSRQVERQADGRYRVRLRLRQQDVPGIFRMPVPVAIETTDGARTVVRVEVRGPLTEAELLLPSEPIRFEVNPLESVLAEVKEEGWREGT